MGEEQRPAREGRPSLDPMTPHLEKIAPRPLVLTDAVAAALDRLLDAWWAYEHDYRGLPRAARASSIYLLGKPSEVHDDSAERAEATPEFPWHALEACGAEISALSRELRNAIEITMVSRHTRAAVWRSRSPGADVEALYADAQAALLPVLRRRGVAI